jgi:hypothetical protein
MTQILTSRYISSILLCLGMLVNSLPAWSKTRYRPAGIQLGIDALRPFQYKYYGRTGTPYELNASIDFARCILEGDYGRGYIRWEGYNAKTNTSSSYTSSGQYFRVGLNYNLLQDTPNKNIAFWGFRYARSFSQDHLVGKVSYDSDGPVKTQNVFIDSKQNNVQASWFEAVVGVKVKVWKLLYAGGTLRYKFGLCIDQSDSHVPYDMLGWGLNDQEEAFDLNLYLSLRIPFPYDTLPSNPQE